MITKQLVVSVFTCALFAHGNYSIAETIYQSGELGSTGIPAMEVGFQNVPATNVAVGRFVGSRFLIEEPAVITSIGGHFVGPFGNEESSFFGSLVSLSEENDFPDSRDLSTPDVLGHTILSFPAISEEIVGDLSLTLQPGWYAVVFGSGLFGASGRGAALTNSSDSNQASFINWSPNIPGDGWFNREILRPEINGDLRFVVNGFIVSEPSGAVLMLLGLPLLYRFL